MLHAGSPQVEAREEATIQVRRISKYGVDTGKNTLASPLRLDVKPSSHEAGGTHTVSVAFLSRASGVDEKCLLAWLGPGQPFIKLEWTYPEYDYPKWTTRHLVLPDGPDDHVGLSGGTGFATRMFNHVQSFPSAATLSSSQGQRFSSTRHRRAIPQNSRKSPPESTYVGRPGRSYHGNWRQQRYSPFHSPLRDTPPAMSPPSWDDQSSVYTESVSTPSSDLDTGALSPSPVQHPEPKQFGDECSNRRLHQQLQIEALGQQRREAEELFAQTGDTSGLLHVMASAAEANGIWHPGGLPRF
ncbi:hypothetical protein B0H63DRAFT_524056 [Podospora didyma]|uniref:Uncharacterized protein n=1 Tax=Podospora didyma TaxID=330526 RepID=A0AAE0NGX8_9PEZI|nr:hypothetical protein B0H63DRAFT_524056 [Podospora didyma]